MKIEIWKSLEFLGYPNYEISNFGRVKSLERTIIRKDGRKKTYKSKLLKTSKNSTEYLSVVLHKNGKPKFFTVHRLVALVFIPNDNPIEKTEINHLDENKENNHVSNLCWCTRKENMNYGTINERKSESMKRKMSGENHPLYGKHHSEETKQKMRKGRKGKKPILQYTKDMIFVREWDSGKTASEELNLSQGNITECCQNKRKTSGNFIWRHKD